jgi:hypothetical protein
LPAEPRTDVAGGLAELGQVLADAEAAARAGDHDGAHVGVARVLQRTRERLVHRRVERVEHVGRLSVIVRTAPSRASRPRHARDFRRSPARGGAADVAPAVASVAATKRSTRTRAPSRVAERLAPSVANLRVPRVARRRPSTAAAAPS